MESFDYSFAVDAHPRVVSGFHRDTRALRRLTPPPVFIQFLDIEPLGEGSTSELRMWFGPIPIRWTAVHRDVSEEGFTDVQARGPMQAWAHTHRFVAEGDGCRIVEHVEFEHKPGWVGWLTRLAFGRPALKALFAYRKAMTRRALRAGTEFGE